MDFALSTEQRLIVETVRSFVETELYPHESEVERLDAVPDEVAADIRTKALKAGLYAANMPAELGGGGLDAVSTTLVERELGRASYALQMLVARPSNILQACTGDQVQRYLLPTIRGERHDCLAMTEPDAGSDVRSMQTRAVPTAATTSSTARSTSSATPTRPTSSSCSRSPASSRPGAARARRSARCWSTWTAPASTYAAVQAVSRIAGTTSCCPSPAPRSDPRWPRCGPGRCSPGTGAGLPATLTRSWRR